MPMSRTYPARQAALALPAFGLFSPRAMLLLAVLFPAGQLIAGATPGLLDYLKNPATPVTLDWALPDQVVVNGAKAPAPPAAQPEPVAVAAKTPEPAPAAKPEAAPEASLEPATPEPVAAAPTPMPDPAPAAPEPVTLAAQAPQAAAPALAAAPVSAASPAPSPATEAPVQLAALPPQPLGGEILPPPDPADPATIPPEGNELDIALQTFLDGLNCYAGKADGSFGPGSLGALALFYDTNPTLVRQEEPTGQAWRDLQAKGVTACPAPYAPKKADPAPAKTSSTKPAATPKPAKTPKPAAAPAPAKPAASMSDLAAAAN